MVLQFQADANLAFGLLREGAAATNSEELGFTQGKFVEVIATLEESLEDMADDGEAKDLLGMSMMLIRPFGAEDDSIFSVRGQELQSAGVERSQYRTLRLGLLMDVQSTQEELLFNIKPLVKQANKRVGTSAETMSEK